MAFGLGAGSGLVTTLIGVGLLVGGFGGSFWVVVIGTGLFVGLFVV